MDKPLPKFTSYFSVLLNFYTLIVWCYVCATYGTSTARLEWFDYAVFFLIPGVVFMGIQLFLLMYSLYFLNKTRKNSELNLYCFFIQIAFTVFFIWNLAK